VPEGPVLVCNASFDRNKRHAELLDWLAPLLRSEPSAVLVLFGHRWFDPQVWELVNVRPRELGIGAQVRVTDWISYPEIRELLAWSSLTIINSLRETQCLAVYEALAAGVPTLISAIPELTSQFPNLPAHATGEVLRANVRRVLSEPELGRSLVESSQERVGWADITRHDQVFHATLERLLARRSMAG
jgi:glycosyltransferase involved in cell wall biosynthesis